jgi:cardiolipin synthase
VVREKDRQEVKLIIQPDDGVMPLVQAVRNAKKTIDIVIFRFDRAELEKALEAAVARGVVVRALIAHTNRGGEKILRKLELRLLDAGVTVARTADDLPRYHGKMMLVDDTLHVFGFNYTKLDIEKSRSFGIVTDEPRLVKEACTLFEADCTRQSYSLGCDDLVVSPETSRDLLSLFIKKAKKELLIYDPKVSDRLMLRLLAARAKAGVTIRMFGKVGRGATGVEARKLPDLRIHVRAMIRDGAAVFIGSQSLRKLELDGRREIGVIVSDERIAKKIRDIFEADWAQTAEAKQAAVAAEKDKEKEKDKDKEKEKEKEKATSGA